MLDLVDIDVDVAMSNAMGEFKLESSASSDIITMCYKTSHDKMDEVFSIWEGVCGNNRRQYDGGAMLHFTATNDIKSECVETRIKSLNSAMMFDNIRPLNRVGSYMKGGEHLSSFKYTARPAKMSTEINNMIKKLVSDEHFYKNYINKEYVIETNKTQKIIYHFCNLSDILYK